MVNYEEKQTKWPKWKKPGWGGRNIASVSFLQLPRTSVDIRDICGRKTEERSCEIMRKTEENRPEWEIIGRDGRNIAAVSFRQLPRASVDIRDMGGKKAEDGSWGIMRKNRGKLV